MQVARKSEQCDVEGLLLQRGAVDDQDAAWAAKDGAFSPELVNGATAAQEGSVEAQEASAAGSETSQHLTQDTAATAGPVNTEKAGSSKATLANGDAASQSISGVKSASADDNHKEAAADADASADAAAAATADMMEADQASATVAADAVNGAVSAHDEAHHGSEGTQSAGADTQEAQDADVASDGFAAVSSPRRDAVTDSALRSKSSASLAAGAADVATAALHAHDADAPPSADDAPAAVGKAQQNGSASHSQHHVESHEDAELEVADDSAVQSSEAADAEGADSSAQQQSRASNAQDAAVAQEASAVPNAEPLVGSTAAPADSQGVHEEAAADASDSAAADPAAAREGGAAAQTAAEAVGSVHKAGHVADEQQAQPEGVTDAAEGVCHSAAAPQQTAASEGSGPSSAVTQSTPATSGMPSPAQAQQAGESLSAARSAPSDGVAGSSKADAGDPAAQDAAATSSAAHTNGSRYQGANTDPIA